MKLLFTICGRAGSKGIKNKNLKEFLDYPLAFYSVSAIDLYKKQNPQHEYDFVLNTDSTALIELFRDSLKVDFNIIFRDASLGEDHTPKISVISNCLEQMRERKSRNYDMVVDLDITSPLRTVQDIDHLVKKKLETASDVVFSVTDSRRNPYFNMVKKTEMGYERVNQSNFNSRQEAPEIFDMNASLYAYSPTFLESGKGIFEGRCDIVRMFDTAILDIDHENDFELMQVIARYLFDKFPEFSQIRNNISSILK